VWEDLHKSVNFADVGIRCIDNSDLDCVVLTAPEVVTFPEEDWDILMNGRGVDYLLVCSVYWVLTMS
jgi:hypothetical protein